MRKNSPLLLRQLLIAGNLTTRYRKINQVVLLDEAIPLAMKQSQAIRGTICLEGSNVIVIYILFLFDRYDSFSA